MVIVQLKKMSFKKFPYFTFSSSQPGFDGTHGNIVHICEVLHDCFFCHYACTTVGSGRVSPPFYVFFEVHDPILWKWFRLSELWRHHICFRLFLEYGLTTKVYDRHKDIIFRFTYIHLNCLRGAVWCLRASCCQRYDLVRYYAASLAHPPHHSYVCFFYIIRFSHWICVSKIPRADLMFIFVSDRP